MVPSKSNISTHIPISWKGNGRLTDGNLQSLSNITWVREWGF
ncbi:hypothetical protein SynBIOSE41_01137 [Synechococcus sp. BIOS-E4-1]|nr:hypothetical protein SynBIOSE41_01137 [Synechococcus sp. BIOS-E4-1]